MKKLSSLILFLLVLFYWTNIVSAQTGPPVPNNYIQSVTSSANTAGMKMLIDCSKPGMSTLSAIVSSTGSATVNLNAIGQNPDGTPNLAFSITYATMLSAASGASSPLNIPVGAFSFYQLSSSTSGVGLTYIAGCR